MRNVLIYFRPELQRRVIETVEGALSEDGILFLGPSESLLHLGTRLNARDLGECFCYQRAVSTRGDEARAADVETAVDRSSIPPPGASRPGTDSAHRSEPPPPFDFRLESMIDALARGESGRAVAGLRALCHERPESAVAHALEGVALERNGDEPGAARAYRAALYLAPEMDEIRFLLAQVLERLGRTSASAREYRTALSGLGPADVYITSVLDRLGLPDSDQMSRTCREKLFFK